MEQQQQQQECTVMGQEDRRSDDMERYIRCLDEWISGVATANGRARELKRARDLSERKVAEDQLARGRADQHVQRVKMFHQRKLDILEKEAVDNRMDVVNVINFHCGDERYLDVQVARDACQKLLEQLLSLRRRKVKAMQMELRRREKLETFETQYRKLESNLREAQREQRAHNGRYITANVLGDANFHESRHSDTSVTKQVQPGAYQSVLKERREIWSLAVGYVQRLKLAIGRKEIELRAILRSIREYIPSLRNQARRVCSRNERIITLKVGVETKNTTMRLRTELLAREQSILKRHGGAFFDTDVWQEGVTQRIPSGRFRKQVQAELARMARETEKNMQEINRFDKELAVEVAKRQKIDLNIQELNEISCVTEERLNRAVSRTTMQDLLNANQEAGLVKVSASPKSKNERLAQMIRRKPSNQRSLEEKQWVALDIFMTREVYMDSSVLEKEELQLSDEYRTDLQPEDVAKILQLPQEMQLALPHLRSHTEIDAHQLLTKYSHGRGGVEIARADELSQDCCFLNSWDDKQPYDSWGEKNPAYTAPREDRVKPPSESLGERQPHTPPRKQEGRGTRTGYQDKMGTVTTLVGTSTSSLAAIDSGILTQEPKRNPKKIIIFDSLSDVAIKGKWTCNKDEQFAVRVGEREVYRSATSLLERQKTQVHRFSVVDTPTTYSVDLKVTIVLKGCIGLKGFSRGRASAVLRRRPKSSEICSSVDECIGYAPHSHQKLNIGDQFHQTPGAIFIQHCPRRVQLEDFVYEVEVSALAMTEYSVVVVAGQCELCASLVEKRLKEAKSIMARLDYIALDLASIWEVVGLRERQFRVCRALIEEATSECLRCQKSIDDLCKNLYPRDVPVGGAIVASSRSIISRQKLNRESGGMSRSMSSSPTSSRLRLSTTVETAGNTATASFGSWSELSEKEREKNWKEIAAIEMEYMHWGRLFTTRSQGKESVKKALQDLLRLRRDGKAEKDRLQVQLRQTAAEIPVVVLAMHGPSEAARVSKELNKWPRPDHKCLVDSSPAMTSFETPASTTRHNLERYGWEILNLEQQQWVTLDQAMNPEQYTWLQQRQQEEAKRKLNQRVKVHMKPHENPAVERCRFERDELTRILAEPFEDLNRNERHIRKLLHKFHDDPDRVKMESTMTGRLEEHHKKATRVRQTDERSRTKAEQEWVSLDEIINPQVWNRAKQGVPSTHNDERPPCFDSGCNILDQGQQKPWTCPFSRAQLLRIWGTDGEVYLATEDEKRVYRLLMAFNGVYQEQSPDGMKHGREVVLTDKHTSGPYIGMDINVDRRLRYLQQELKIISITSKPFIKSCVIHAAPQQYPTSTLRLEVEAEIDHLLREQVQQRERKNIHLTEDYRSSEDERYDFGNIQATRRTRRLKRRGEGADVNEFAMRKRMLIDAKKSPLQKEYARRVAKLGPGGCPACMSTRCNYLPVVDVEETKSRIGRIVDELHFARISSEDMIESGIPLSVQRDGVTTFRRTNLIDQLCWEQNNLRHMLKLHFIDQEFHDANRTSREHIECVTLHGYRTLLWTKDARVALGREHDRLVARLLAAEIVHDILASMLEGWYFGERPSRHEAVGYVPSLKKTGFIKAGIDAKGRAESSRKEAEVKVEDRVASLTLPPCVDGSSWNKSEERVVKPGGALDEVIDFSLKTMQFGLFCVSIMYFRALWLLRQKREGVIQTKSGRIIDIIVPVRARRNKDIIQAITGIQARKEKEEAQVLADFAGFFSVESRELDAAQLVQRLYRGHISRKAGLRWRAKRAEYYAINSLLVSAAVTIQRVARGYSGRRRARVVRANIARWLVHLFDDETREFKAQLLSTNRVEALKRGIRHIHRDNYDDQ